MPNHVVEVGRRVCLDGAHQPHDETAGDGVPPFGRVPESAPEARHAGLVAGGGEDHRGVHRVECAVGMGDDRRGQRAQRRPRQGAGEGGEMEAPEDGGGVAQPDVARVGDALWIEPR